MIIFKSITKQAYSPTGLLYVTEIRFEIKNDILIPVDLPPVVDGVKAVPTKKDRNYGLKDYLE